MVCLFLYFKQNWSNWNKNHSDVFYLLSNNDSCKQWSLFKIPWFLIVNETCSNGTRNNVFLDTVIKHFVKLVLKS